ncbi:MAG: ACT domain-containing protein [Coriobacteriia bacterium]
MRTEIVFTLTGPDRVGIVEEVTRVMLALDANVETSRMARLGGEFAILMLASLPEDAVTRVDGAFASLVSRGYKVTTNRTEAGDAGDAAGRLRYRIVVEGADHEGIIHEIAAGLSARGVNIESMETAISEAPVSGTPLFFMTAIVAVPPDLAETDWIEAVTEAGEQANVDVEVTVAERA